MSVVDIVESLNVHILKQKYNVNTVVDFSSKNKR